MASDSTDENGVVLIALLWILTALAVIALSFSKESFVEVAAARNARDLAEAYYLARAGVSSTAFLLTERRMMPRLQQLDFPGPPDSLDLGLVTGALGRGEYKVEIQDESGKFNLNYVTEEPLRNLVTVLGIERHDADVIVDSILDWRDVDNAHHINGAEDEYYQRLNPPYKARNGRIETVEELLLVRGVTRDYFYGIGEQGPDGSRQLKYGLQRCLTAYGGMQQQINVNFAPLEVLAAVPGMTLQAAQAIYERRQSKPFATLEEITRVLPISLPPSSMVYLSTVPTGVYTLTASAKLAGSKATRVIRTVITLDLREPTGYRVIYWNENVPRI